MKTYTFRAYSRNNTIIFNDSHLLEHKKTKKIVTGYIHFNFESEIMNYTGVILDGKKHNAYGLAEFNSLKTIGTFMLEGKVIISVWEITR